MQILRMAPSLFFLDTSTALNGSIILDVFSHRGTALEWQDRLIHVRLTKLCPSVHEIAAFVEQIATPVGGLGGVFHDVR